MLEQLNATCEDILSADFQPNPMWRDAVDLPNFETQLPKKTDIVIIGSGYTGLNAAIECASAGKSVVILEKNHPGWGCSTRNGGQISTSIKPSLKQLSKRFGAARGWAIRQEGHNALSWIEERISELSIDCGFRRNGRIHAAHCSKAFPELIAGAEENWQREKIPYRALSKSDLAGEIASPLYHGGVLFPNHAALHPGKYYRGLLRAAMAADAQIIPFCEAQEIQGSGQAKKIITNKGIIHAGQVGLATNGYSGGLMPWFQRRIIPISSSVMATELLDPTVVNGVFRNDRIASDTRRIVYYYSPTQDRTRITFGGRVTAAEASMDVVIPRLYAELIRIFPQLSGVKISHGWQGTVGYSFDALAHTGTHEDVVYAMGYCGSGVSMASYLGMRMGKKLLGLAEGETAFDNLPFPTRPFYTGQPWFLPAVVGWYRWRDSRELNG